MVSGQVLQLRRLIWLSISEVFLPAFLHVSVLGSSGLLAYKSPDQQSPYGVG